MNFYDALGVLAQQAPNKYDIIGPNLRLQSLRGILQFTTSCRNTNLSSIGRQETEISLFNQECRGRRVKAQKNNFK